MVTTRRASACDVEILTRLRLALLRELGNLKEPAQETAVAAAVRDYLNANIPEGKFIAWVAEADGQIVGMSGLVIFDSLPAHGNLSGREGYVMNMYTRPEWRGKGIATHLTRELVDFMRHTDAKRIWLLATREGRPVYEKVGFVLPEAYSCMQLFLTDEHQGRHGRR